MGRDSQSLIILHMMAELNVKSVRSVYLITYSQADLDIAPTRQAFADMVINTFINKTPATPIQWTCSQEYHQDGGVHYHLALKLDRQQRWLSVRNALEREHQVKVNFSDRHDNYYSAFCYTYNTPSDHHDSKEKIMRRFKLKLLKLFILELLENV